jgi:hypothetical protein
LFVRLHNDCDGGLAMRDGTPTASKAVCNKLAGGGDEGSFGGPRWISGAFGGSCGGGCEDSFRTTRCVRGFVGSCGGGCEGAVRGGFHFAADSRHWSGGSLDLDVSLTQLDVGSHARFKSFPGDIGDTERDGVLGTTDGDSVRGERERWSSNFLDGGEHERERCWRLLRQPRDRGCGCEGKVAVGVFGNARRFAFSVLSSVFKTKSRSKSAASFNHSSDIAGLNTCT